MDDMQEGELDEVQRDEPEDEFDGGQGNEFFIQNVSVIDHDRYFKAVRAKGKTTKKPGYCGAECSSDSHGPFDVSMGDLPVRIDHLLSRFFHL